ncbi:MAG: transposase [Suilimivivens sp.]
MIRSNAGLNSYKISVKEWTEKTNATQTKEDKEKGHILLQICKNEERLYSSKTRTGRWDFTSLYPMTFRVVRFKLETGEYETLAKSLPRSITLTEIKKLYHARWGIETAFRELKYGLGLVNLHGKKDDFVMQEIFAAMTTANLCRQLCRTKGADAKKLLHNIARYTEPVRPGRCDERNMKAKSFVGFIYRVSTMYHKME